MDPAVLMALIMGGSNLLGGLLGGGDQELEGFGGDEFPPRALAEAGGVLRKIAPYLQAQATRPINLRSAYAQRLPIFSGGGLPMPIGAMGQDPALANPDLLSLAFPEPPAAKPVERYREAGDEDIGVGARRRRKGDDAAEAMTALRFIL